jgi:hypothetical protein
VLTTPLAVQSLSPTQRVSLVESDVWATFQRFSNTNDPNPNLTVQSAALRALANLTHECKPAQAVLRTGDRLREITSSTTTLISTTAHGALAVLDVWGSLAIGCSNVAECTLLVDAHVVEQTVQLMQRHDEQPAILDAGVLVLWAIAQHYGKLVGTHATEVVAQAVEKYGPQIRYGKRLQGRLQWKQKWGRR